MKCWCGEEAVRFFHDPGLPKKQMHHGMDLTEGRFMEGLCRLCARDDAEVIRMESRNARGDGRENTLAEISFEEYLVLQVLEG